MAAPITPISPLPFESFTVTLPAATVVELDPQPYSNTKEVLLLNLDAGNRIFVKMVNTKEENAYAIIETRTGVAGGVSPFLVAGDIIAINGVPLTAVVGARTPGADDFSIDPTSLTALAAEIAAAINDPANAFATYTATAYAPLPSTARFAQTRLEVNAAGVAGNLLTIAVVVANAGSITLPVNGGGTFIGGKDGLPAAASVDINTSLVLPLSSGATLAIGSEGNRHPLATAAFWATNDGSGLGIVAKAEGGANLLLNVTYVQNRGYPDGV